jgi:3-oxoacyl-[acyl-carrier-protein] synthase II
LTVKRAVVTGIGALTPLGNSFIESWEAVKAGHSGIVPVARFDASGIKWRHAGELKGFLPGDYLSKKEILRLDPFIAYAYAAALMALKDAGLNEGGLTGSGIVAGSSRAGITTIEKALLKKPGAFLMPSTGTNMAAAFIAKKFGVKGYTLGISNACSSGSNAVGEALRLIREGILKKVIAGGSDAPICGLCMSGYGIMGALSKGGAVRPFDRLRDGFILSEGACMLVIEELLSALERGAKIYGEVSGYGNTCDAFHETRPDPIEEAGAIVMALNDAGLSTDDVDYISAHATGTPVGDKTETEAIKLAFGKRAHDIHIGAIKSMTGHMLAASGAFEAGAALMSLKEGVIPPTINLEDKDPECDLNYSTKPLYAPLKTALCNSFGFGGANSVVVLRTSPL